MAIFQEMLASRIAGVELARRLLLAGVCRPESLVLGLALSACIARPVVLYPFLESEYRRDPRLLKGPGRRVSVGVGLQVFGGVRCPPNWAKATTARLQVRPPKCADDHRGPQMPFWSTDALSTHSGGGRASFPRKDSKSGLFQGLPAATTVRRTTAKCSNELNRSSYEVRGGSDSMRSGKARCSSYSSLWIKQW